MTYGDYIQNIIKNQDPGMPIYTDEIVKKVMAKYGLDKKKAAAATAVAMKRIIDGGKIPDLRRYQKGIYYRTLSTLFGETGIDKGRLIADKYLLPDNGYETGLRLLHSMGLTTQMPTEYLLATNSAKDCQRYDKKLGVSVCPPRVHINAENKPYLQTLDALDLLEKAPIDVENPYAVIARHIRRNNLNYETLLYYADRYYNRKTIIQLAHTAGEGRKEFEIL